MENFKVPLCFSFLLPHSALPLALPESASCSRLLDSIFIIRVHFVAIAIRSHSHILLHLELLRAKDSGEGRA